MISNVKNSRRRVALHFILVIVSTVVFSMFTQSCQDVVDPTDPSYELAPPTLKSAHDISDIEIELKWIDNEEYTEEFIIERKHSAEEYIVVATLPKTQTSHIDTCYVQGRYTYCIRSKVGAKTSKQSNGLIASLDFIGPVMLKHTIMSDSSIKIEWTDYSDYESGFIVKRDDGLGYHVIDTLDANIEEYIDTGLDYGNIYKYNISTYTRNGNTLGSPITITLAQPEPSNLKASSVSDTEIELKWDDNCLYEDGFVIQRNAGNGFVNIATVGSDVTNHTDVGLTYCERYAYRVFSYSENHGSTFSNESVAYSITPVVDIDGNRYNVVPIGNQFWMAENLKVTHYRDGTPIPKIVSASDWKNCSSGAYCYYTDNYYGQYGNIYGALYNGYVSTDVRNLAPEGWHVPTDDDWKELEITLGMNQSEADSVGYRGTNEGSKLAGCDYWSNSPLKGNSAFGSSDFNALPSGRRFNIGGYSNVGEMVTFWSSTQFDSSSAWSRGLYEYYSNIARKSLDNRYGLSIRLVKN